MKLWAAAAARKSAHGRFALRRQFVIGLACECARDTRIWDSSHWTARWPNGARGELSHEQLAALARVPARARRSICPALNLLAPFYATNMNNHDANELR